jgi:hypothetical protein
MAPRSIERLRIALIVAACVWAAVVTATLARGDAATVSHARNAGDKRLGGIGDPGRPTPASAIEALVSTYRRGDPAAAMAEFLKWDAKRVAREAMLPADAPPADVAALALMHTMAAVARGTFGGRQPAARSRPDVFPAAFSLVGTLSRRADCPRIQAAPSAATGASSRYRCERRRNYAETSVVVQAGQRPFGNDPQFLLAAGSTAEALMGPFASGGGLVSSRGIVGDDRLDAE